MASETNTLSPSSFIKHPDILMSLGVVGVIMLMVLPLPRFRCALVGLVSKDTIELRPGHVEGFLAI